MIETTDASNPDISLSLTLSKLLEEYLDSQLGDRTLSVSIPQSWKLSEALIKLSRKNSTRIIKIFSSNPILSHSQLIAQSNLEVTEDWSLATQWRNDNSLDRNFDFIIVGPMSENGTAGLRGIKNIDEQIVSDAWFHNLESLLKDTAIRNDRNVSKLLKEIRAKLLTYELEADSIEKYISAIYNKTQELNLLDPQIFSSYLYLLKLFSDTQILSGKGRLTKNIVQYKRFVNLEHEFENKLKAMKRDTPINTTEYDLLDDLLTLHLVQNSDMSLYLKNKNNLTLQAIEKLFKKDPIVSDQINDDLYKFLNRLGMDNSSSSPGFDETLNSVKAAICTLREKIIDLNRNSEGYLSSTNDDDETDEGHSSPYLNIKIPTAIQHYEKSINLLLKVRKIKPDIDNSFRIHKLSSVAPWTTRADDNDVYSIPLAFQTERPLPCNLSELISDDEQTLNTEYFKDRISPADRDNLFLERMTKARIELQSHEYLLTHNPLEYLIASIEVRSVVRSYLVAYQKLQNHILEDGRSSNKTHLIHLLQHMDLILGPVGLNNVHEWILLGPIHPLVLGPLLEISDHISTELDQLRKPKPLGSSLYWSLDHSLPSFNSIYLNTVHYSYSEKKNEGIGYCFQPSRLDEIRIPSLSDHSYLEKLTDHIVKHTPWISQSLSILLVNPPNSLVEGSGILKFINNLHTQYQNNLYVYLLNTTPIGTTDLEGYVGDKNIVRYQCTDREMIKKLQTIPDVNLAIQFLPETKPQNQQVVDMKPGSNRTLESRYHFKTEFLNNQYRPQIIIEYPEGTFAGNFYKLDQLLIGTTRQNQLALSIRKFSGETSSGFYNKTDWYVEAVPGFYNDDLVSNADLTLAGRGSSGKFNFYVYSSDRLVPIVVSFNNYLRECGWTEMDINNLEEVELYKLIRSNSNLGMGSLRSHNPIAIQEQIGIMAMLQDISKSTNSHIYLLSLDEFSWTKHWFSNLSGESERADFLLLEILSDGKIRITFLECKTNTDEKKIDLRSSNPTIIKAKTQIQESLKRMKLLFKNEDNVNQDIKLRFSNFIQHLLFKISSQWNQAGPYLDESKIASLEKSINNLCGSDLKDITFMGRIYLVQPKVDGDYESSDLGENIGIVWLGRHYEKSIITGSVSLYPVDTNRISQCINVDNEMSSDEQVVNGNPSLGPTNEMQNQQTFSNTIIKDENTTSFSDAKLVSLTSLSNHGDIQSLSSRFISIAKHYRVPLNGSEPTNLAEGPSFFSFKVVLRPGKKEKELTDHLVDIARDMGLAELGRNFAAEPYENGFRILIPKKDRQVITLPEQLPLGEVGGLWNGRYLPMHLGQDLFGKDLVTTVESWPHVLIAGSTGSGKSTLMKSIILQLNKHGAHKVNYIVIDGKGDGDFHNSVDPLLFHPEFKRPVTDKREIVSVLKWIDKENQRRQQKALSYTNTKKDLINTYKSHLSEGCPKSEDIEKPLIVIIDEFADLVIQTGTNKKVFEQTVSSLAATGRSRMIHLIVATQRPDKNVMKGVISANLPTRMILQVSALKDSMVVMSRGGAENLLKHGDTLFIDGSGTTKRIQTYNC